MPGLAEVFHSRRSYSSPVLYPRSGRIAPCLSSRASRSFNGTFPGEIPRFAAIEAAAAAACPAAMHGACTRNPELAKRSLDKLRPATRRLRLPLGISAPSGMVGTVPGLSGLGRTPDLVCRSTG